jgi:hypothetical protein
MAHTSDIGVVATALGAVAATIFTAFILLPWIIS